MGNLTAIILTYNEAPHIERCVKSIECISSKIIVIDSFSNDRTVTIAKSLGVELWQHEFTNHAAQFNWALDNLPINTDWILRIDADEYLEPDLQTELHEKLGGLPENIIGIYLKRKVLFEGKWIRHGGFFPHILLRIWRNGKGRFEQRWMDEHAVLPNGSKTIIARGHLVDDNRKGITFWINKHNSYASREAAELLSIKYHLLEQDNTLKTANDPQARRKRLLKEKVYVRLPAGLRAGAYFFYRYFLRLGFLDGANGFIWHFMQGFWYRLLVDIKVMEVEARSGGDLDKMKQILFEEHGVKI